MKPADLENKTEDRKLFVGMISKQMKKQDVLAMFSRFGNVEECRVFILFIIMHFINQFA